MKWNNPKKGIKVHKPRIPSGEKCPKCGKDMHVSNVDEDKLVCHNCNNVIYKEEV